MSIDMPSNLPSVITPNDVDESPLVGTWQNTNAASRQIAGLRIQVVDGCPMVNVWGASRPLCLDWGTIPIERLYRGSPGAAQAAAFEASFQFGPMTALLEANLSKGLLIIACMKTFGDGSGRSPYFVREFFRKTDEFTTPTLAPIDRGRRPVTCADDDATLVLEPASLQRLDPGAFLGRWANTDAATRGFREVRMSEWDSGLLLEIHGAEDPPEGARCEGAATLFAEHSAGTVSTQFHAAIDRAGQRMRMHGWVKLGVLVIAVFRSSVDSPASAPWFDREFFAQTDRL
jgi:hypothetical protein